MSVKKVFITGATGFIGGDALYAVQHAQPSWELTVLVRDEDKAAEIEKTFPNVKFAFGSLDEYDVIKDAAAQSDIVIHTADSSDHAGAARAIAEGLASTHSSSNPAHYIHISGTGLLCWYDYEHDRFGQAPLPDQVYNDLEGVTAVTERVPDYAWHRDVDKIVLAEAARDPASVKIAIVCPPTIYGIGRGPGNQRSRQVPTLIALTLDNGGAAPIIGDGLAEWDSIHVHDLSALILLLAERAANTSSESDDGSVAEIFGPRGYHFCENGIHRWGHIAEVVSQEVYKQGLVADGAPSTKKLDVEEARDNYGMEPVTWGLNSRGEARRARKYLGWTPKSPSLIDTIPEMVRYEGEQLKQGLSNATGKPTPLPVNFNK